MYTPKAFVVDDQAMLHADIHRSGLAILVSMTKAGMIATHLPVLLDVKQGANGTILGHISRANLQGRDTDTSVDGLIIFTGPETYVTPSWYPAKQETGRVVPTWNYAAIHAYGPLSFFEDAERLRDIVTRLTDKFESQRPKPWQVTDAPSQYIDSQLKAIIGFEMPISRLEGKRKFNQNRSAEDRSGVIQGLRKLGDEQSAHVADLMAQIESHPGPTNPDK